MPVIDADTHVFECDDTFSYLDESERQFAPVKVDLPVPDGKPPRGYWLLGGQQFNRNIRLEGDIWKTLGELLDVRARVRAIDEMGVDVQVVYPTFFLKGIASQMQEVALARSYNRWMADRCEQSGGRMRWIAIAPLANVPTAVEELRRAKDHGACGVLKKGDEEAGYWPCESYFFPFYEEAQRLDLPICFHVGCGYTGALPSERMPHLAQHRMHFSSMSAFSAIITFQMVRKFPTLRWGFIELSASWIPYQLYYMRRILAKSANEPEVARQVAGSTGYAVPNDVLAKNNIYVSCFVDEDLPTIIRSAGEDNLLVGSDFVHVDHATELNFVGALQQRVDRGDISPTVLRKITYDNPRAFYGL